MSKCHIVGNLMSRLNFIACAGLFFLIVSDEETGTREDELEQTE